MSTAPKPAELARTALAAAGHAAGPQAWLVGGAVRDLLLGLSPLDLDLAVAGDPEPVAGAVSAALRAPRFPLSDRFGGFRVTGAGGLQVDVMPLHPDGLAADLLRRDLTVNALALPLADALQWPTIDPARIIDLAGGLADLQARVLRAGGPTAMLDDPLRVLRVARMIATDQWTIDGDTARLCRAAAAGLSDVAGERIGSELRGTIAGSRALDGLDALRRLGAVSIVLPELAALDGVQQSSYHHLDVGGHTREVLEYTLELETGLAAFVDEQTAEAVTNGLAQELGGGWSAREAVRFAALLHDIAKPLTRTWNPERQSPGFPGHDRVGQRVAGEIMERLRAPRKVVRAVQAMTLHHLRLGFLTHTPVIDAGLVYDYLRTCEPVEVEVTVLALADRLATRGRRAERAITAHAELTRRLLPEAVAWRQAGGAPAPLLDGDVLVAQSGQAPGPWLGPALEAQRRARFIDPQLTAQGALAAALDR